MFKIDARRFSKNLQLQFSVSGTCLVKKIENNALKMHLYERFKLDALGTSQGRHPTDVSPGRFEDVRNCMKKQQLTFKYFTQHIW